MIVLFTKFSKFLKTSYMIVQKFSPPSAAFFSCIYLFLIAKTTWQRFCEFLARLRRDFDRFRCKPKRFSIRKYTFQHWNFKFFACGGITSKKTIEKVDFERRPRKFYLSEKKKKTPCGAMLKDFKVNEAVSSAERRPWGGWNAEKLEMYPVLERRRPLDLDLPRRPPP